MLVGDVRRPEWRELFALLDPEIERKTLFLDTGEGLGLRGVLVHP